jgi:hypothetical protein
MVCRCPPAARIGDRYSDWFLRFGDQIFPLGVPTIPSASPSLVSDVTDLRQSPPRPSLLLAILLPQVDAGSSQPDCARRSPTGSRARQHETAPPHCAHSARLSVLAPSLHNRCCRAAVAYPRWPDGVRGVRRTRRPRGCGDSLRRKCDSGATQARRLEHSSSARRAAFGLPRQRPAPSSAPTRRVRRTVAVGQWRVRDRAASSGRYPRCGTAPSSCAPGRRRGGASPAQRHARPSPTGLC